MSLRKGYTAVIYAPIIDTDISVPLYPKERYNEIIKCKNEKVRLEKYLVWKLLERTVGEYLNLDFDNLQFTKTNNGQWVCPEFYFSLSHTDSIVCVAVSDTPVGVDAESVREINDGLSRKVLTEDELSFKEKLPPEKKNDYLLESWVKKESIFKRWGAEALLPNRIKTEDHPTFLLRTEVNGSEHLISVCCDNTDKTEFKYMEEI